MKAKAGVIKDNVFQKLLEGGMSIYTSSANQVQIHLDKNTPQEIMVKYKHHKYKVHAKRTREDWRGRRFTSLSEVFTLQWYKSGKRPKRK